MTGGDLHLLDWRRRTFALYAEVRALDAARGHERWRAVRDELFAQHPSSALTGEARAAFRGLRYHPYDPRFRYEVEVEPWPGERYDVMTSGGEALALRRVGVVALPIGRLEVFWIDVYGGGLLIPFRDRTSGDTTYGGGRYALDTVKGADLGSTPDGELVVDLNFAYNPSCHYDPRWSCPLAPPANTLDAAVEAGELTYR